MPLKRCAGCHGATYCGRECQREDWPRHGSECKSRDAVGSIYDRGTARDVETALQARFDKLVAFAHENAGKLKMPRDTNYPIDRDAMNKWIEAQESPAVRQFAAAIATSVVHVSFAEFSNALTRVCDWADALPATLSAERPGSRVVPLLLLPDSMRKSNAWATLLALSRGFLKDAHCGLIFTIAEVYRLLDKSEDDAVFLVFAVDDATYSGSQMSDTLFMIASNYRETRETDRHRITVAVVVPYVGEIAPHAIQSANPVLDIIFPPMAVTMKRAVDLLGDAYGRLSRPEQKLAETRFGYSEDPSIGATTVYFDHKMADFVSTITNALDYGETYDAGLRWKGDSVFITGCAAITSRVPYKLRESWGNVCPPAFYKSVEYTKDGVRVYETPPALFGETTP